MCRDHMQRSAEKVKHVHRSIGDTGSPSRGALWRASLIVREARTDRAPAKYGHVKRETGPVQGPVQGKGRGGAFLSVFRTWFRSPDGAQRNPGTKLPLTPPPRITLRSIRATKKKI
jgi:hypothetical protein